jgi:peptide-methionine (R)-S-oxide reductase
VSSLNPLRATEDDSVFEGGGMRTWNPFALAVLKLKFTEPAWTSSLNYKKAAGTYMCANCGSPLFSSSGKYDSGTGWPSFWKTIESDRVALEREWDGRIECKCASCGGHLGHVFPDGPTRGSLDAKELETVPDTDPKIGYKVQGSAGDEESKYSRMPRFCLNGLAMHFEEDKR